MRNNSRTVSQRNQMSAVFFISAALALFAVSTLGWFVYSTVQGLLDSMSLLMENL